MTRVEYEELGSAVSQLREELKDLREELRDEYEEKVSHLREELRELIAKQIDPDRVPLNINQI